MITDPSELCPLSGPSRRRRVLSGGVVLTTASALVLVAASGAGAQTTTSSSSTTTTAGTSTTLPTSTPTPPVEPAPADQDFPEQPRPPGALVTFPGSVAPGGSLTVSGTGCAQGGQVGEAIVVVGNPPAGPFLDASKVANADGTWSVSIPIPAGFSSGNHLVRSACLNAPGSDTGFEYESGTVLVRAAAATPVPASPTFTG